VACQDILEKNPRAKFTKLKKGATVRYTGNIKERNNRVGRVNAYG